MRAFKHLDERHLESFLSGRSIKIGTFQHYRTGETDRVDWLEGGTAMVSPEIRGALLAGNADADLVKDRLSVMGLKLGKNVNFPHIIIHDNIVINRLPNWLIFSASSQPDFSRQEPIIKISKFARFAQLLTHAIPLQVFAPRVGLVFYEDRIANVMTGDPHQPDPFVKDGSWAWEKELRIVWEMPANVQPPEEGFFLLHCPEVASLLSIVGPS